MALTPEQLRAYWEENPDELARAIRENAAAFGLPAGEGGIYSDGSSGPGYGGIEARGLNTFDVPDEAGFDADAYVSGMTMAELQNLMGSGANLPTAEMRRAANAAASRRFNELAGPATSFGGAGYSGGLLEEGEFWGGVDMPTDAAGAINDIYNNLFGRDVAQEGLDYWTEEAARNGWDYSTLEQAIFNGAAPTEDFTDYAYDQGFLDRPTPVEDPVAPNPGGGSGGGGAGGGSAGGGSGGGVGGGGGVVDDPYAGLNPREYNWDWGRFGTQTDEGGFGQYFEPYDASARYSPGEDATWGSDRFPGSNRDFYQNQFGNLLRQEQTYRRRQEEAARAARQAQMIRQGVRPEGMSSEDFAQERQAITQPEPWSWLEGGLPEVDVLESGYASPLQGADIRATSELPTMVIDPTTGRPIPISQLNGGGFSRGGGGGGGGRDVQPV